MKTNDLIYITSHGICLRRNAFLNFAPGMCNYVGGISLDKSNLILFSFVQNNKVCNFDVLKKEPKVLYFYACSCGMEFPVY